MQDQANPSLFVFIYDQVIHWKKEISHPFENSHAE